ncbi:hypothetical protein J2I47_20305 [Fibrella sp. HMF5335]|uniref:Uncharacterized protein n=1 Tax=Fibrella rubiginis TaxID=2817060 RepID=A0A939GGV3_9BACT|nr:hypothetical protein [Fibrella rubiginis]MBO0938907.1 hypothetical protein [Fibrella rubiginis]
MPQLTEQEVIKMAAQALQTHKMGFDPLEGFQARYVENKSLRDGQIDSVWIVSYVTPPSSFDQHDHFMYISDSRGEILYIITQSGYVG